MKDAIEKLEQSITDNKTELNKLESDGSYDHEIAFEICCAEVAISILKDENKNES